MTRYAASATTPGRVVQTFIVHWPVTLWSRARNLTMWVS